MDCALDDDRNIVVVMVDFAISAQFCLTCMYSEKLLATNPIFSHSFDHGLIYSKTKLAYLNVIIANIIAK